MGSHEIDHGQTEKNAMSIVQCPVCKRRYRFHAAKMTKEKTHVKCRKCENVFVISREMFMPSRGEVSPPPRSTDAPSPPSDGVRALTLVIKAVPNETARLRIATRLMPLTRETLSSLIKRLSKTPARFPLEMNPTEADNLLGIIESAGAKAEFSSADISKGSERRRREEVPKKRWKKWAAAAVLAFVLVVGGGISYHMYQETKKTESLQQRGIDSIIPAGASLYLQLKDIEENWTRIQEQATGQGLGALIESLKSTRQIQDLLARKREWESKMGVPFLGPDLLDFIGADARIAFYEGGASGRPDLVVTLKGNLKTKLMETILDFIPEPFRGSLPREVDGEHGIHTFQPQGLRREVYFFSQGMVYVVSTSLDLIRKSTSLANGSLPVKNSLISLSPLIKKANRTGLNQIGLFYMRLGNLMGSWLGKGQKDKTARLPTQMAGYGDVVGTISYGNGLIVESVVAVPSEGLDPSLKALLECPPAANKTLAYVPKNTILYASNNCLELGTHILWLRENVKVHPGFFIAFSRALKGITTQTGVDIEKEILPFLGRGFSYALLHPSRENNVQLPSLQLFFQTEHRAKAEASIGKLLGKPVVRKWFKKAGFDLVRMKYEDVSITYLRYQGDDMRLAFLSALTPHYAFVDDILVIGSELESLKQMVDLSKGRGAPILKDRRFNKMRRLIREKNSGVTYIDLRAASRLLKGLTTQVTMGGFTQIGAGGGYDLQAFCQVLETLNYIWSVAEFEDDRLRLLIYVGL